MSQPWPVANDRTAASVSSSWDSVTDPTWAPAPPLAPPPGLGRPTPTPGGPTPPVGGPPPVGPGGPDTPAGPPAGGPPNPGRPGRAANPPGFADPALLAGLPGATWVYLVVLGFAALADFGTFFQIIGFVMPQEPWWIRTGVVIGFTASALFLSHVAGVKLRTWRAERAEPATPAGRPDRFSITFAWLSIAVWLLLGTFALYLRLTWEDPSNDVRPSGVIAAPADTPAPAADEDDTGPTPAEDYQRTGSALMFLGLYLATGLTATLGGYLTHNPARSAFAKAKRKYDRATDSSAEAARAYTEAKGAVERLELRIRDADLVRWAEQVEILHTGEELKQRTRTRIAQRAQDAALTDAYFPEQP